LRAGRGGGGDSLCAGAACSRHAASPPRSFLRLVGSVPAVGRRRPRMTDSVRPHMHPQRATLSPACAPAIPPPQTRCRAGSVWKTLLRRRGTWSGAPASAVGCMRPGATHRRQQRGSLSAGRRTGVGRRVHGGEQAERRVARDGGRIAALGQRDAAGIVLQQPRDALQGLPQGCRIRAAPLLIRHPRPHTPSSSSLILFFPHSALGLTFSLCCDVLPRPVTR